MKKLLTVLGLIWVFAGCATYAPQVSQGIYNYEYKLIAPIQSNRLLYENDTFAIAFNVTSNSISVNMVNKFHAPIKVEWNDAALVVYGKTGRVAHAGVKFNEANNAMPPVTIPPKATLTDNIISASSVWYSEGYTNFATGQRVDDGWKTAPFFPTDKKIMEDMKISDPEALKGQKISLLLPISINEKEIYYNFAFEVINVSFAPNPKYRAPYQRPKMDMQPGRHSKPKNKK